MPTLPSAPHPAGSSTARATVRRKPERAAYDEATVHAILDEALFCHVGVVRDGCPVVIPTIHARVGHELLLHGSPAAGLLRDARRRVEICVTATIVDGLVLARSPRYHSLNYRSVVIFGRARRLVDVGAKTAALDRIVEHVVPGRAGALRPATTVEIRQTEVLVVALDEASAKIRSGPPVDPEPDRALPIWAGVLPIALEARDPVGAPEVPASVGVPTHVRAWTRSPR